MKRAVVVNLDEMQEVSGEEIDKALLKKKVNMVEVSDVFNNLVGEILTIIDASMSDHGQRKAVKDLVKQSIYDGLDTLHALTDEV